eukprot:CAMPEP_0117451204 /NCGR_PEP_ID=MMETSP0759-20121206/8884_1 /TAXON_ID=63605 /ORGANISM="Percolomonas cosmopolitus, Strain WS" /LENGTH=735 /DNA_ID=CAMNT_0005243791 /DNA_START=114 /DNA_END=2321 /DNA_ORIENTATION=-
MENRDERENDDLTTNVQVNEREGSIGSGISGKARVSVVSPNIDDASTGGEEGQGEIPQNQHVSSVKVSSQTANTSNRGIQFMRFVRIMPACCCIALSSFQYGYNQGVINAPYNAIAKCNIPTTQEGAFFRDCIPMNTLEWSFAVSAMNIGALFTAITAPIFSDHLSRNSVLFYANFFNILGVFLICCFSEIATFIAGRFFVGMASGVFSGVAGIYLAEIATLNTRGLAGSFFGIGITTGLLSQAVLGIFLSEPGVLWRILLGGSVFASFTQLFFLPCVPKSPRFLMLRYVKRTLKYERQRKRKRRIVNDRQELPTEDLDSMPVPNKSASEVGVKSNRNATSMTQQENTDEWGYFPSKQNGFNKQESSTIDIDVDAPHHDAPQPPLQAVHASISQLSLDGSQKQIELPVPAVPSDIVTTTSAHVQLYNQLPPTIQIFRQETIYSLAYFRYGATEAELHNEMEEIETSIRDMAKHRGGLRELLGKWRNLWKLFIAIFLQGSMQACGLALVLSFSLIMFDTAGIPRGDIWNAVVVFADFAASLCAGFLFEKLGRKRSLVATQTLMTLSIIVLATCFIFARVHVTFAIVSVLAMVSFVVWFSIGLAPLAVLISVEIFPNTIRGYGVSAATFSNWVVLTAVTFVFPLYSEWSGKFSLIPFAVFNIFFLIFYIFCVPETKGKSLDSDSKKTMTVVNDEDNEAQDLEMDPIESPHKTESDVATHVDKVEKFDDDEAQLEDGS